MYGIWAILDESTVMDPDGYTYKSVGNEIHVTSPLPVDENWMRVAPGTDAAIWRPWSRETGEL